MTAPESPDGTIWLARHGETTWNVAGRYQGRLESTLTPLGERQAAALAAFFAACRERGEALPARVVSSPLGRCRATAAPSAALLGLAVETDARLIEIGHGTWEGRYRDEIARDDADRYRTWRTAPERVVFEGGESLPQVLERWREFAAELARDQRPALVVTHDAVVRCALVDLLGRPLAAFWDVAVENGAFALIARSRTGLEVLRECDARHLGRLRAEVTQQAL